MWQGRKGGERKANRALRDRTAVTRVSAAGALAFASVVGLASMSIAAIDPGDRTTSAVAAIIGLAVLALLGIAGLVVGTRRSATASAAVGQGPSNAAALLKEVVDGINDAVYLFDAEERLVLCNDAAIKHRRGTPQEPGIGETYEALQRRFLSVNIYGIAAPDQEAFLAERLKAFRNAPAADEMTMPNGRRILVRIFRTSEGGRVVVRTDLSALRHAEEAAALARERATKAAAERERALAESETQIREMMEATADSVFLFDPDERLVRCNTVARETFRSFGFEPRVGSTYEAHVRGLLTVGVHVFSAGEHEAHVQRRLAAFRNAPSEDEIRSTTGQVYYVRFFPTRDGGRLLVRTDITTIRRAEDEIRAARDRAEDANRAKTAFLAAMSHELRTPLNGVIGFAEIMQGGAFGPLGAPEYDECLRDILSSGRRLLEIVDMLLDMAGTESGRFGGNDTPVQVGRVLRSAVNRASRLQGRDEGGRIRIDPSLSNVVLRADPGALARIVGEVLLNAVKFSPPDSPIDIGIGRGADGSVQLRFVDRGIGIDGDRLQTIFEPFRQADSATSRRYGGTGLGLTLAKRLIELHGGGIDIETAPGKGTTVMLNFPPERASAA